MAKEIIRLNQVDFIYDNEFVLENVNISLYRKEMVSIIGPNGSGKTTLLKLILGLLKPTKGSITVLGQLPGKEQQVFGYVPQYAQYDSLFPVNVFDVVLMGCLKPRTFGMFNSRDKNSALYALDVVHLLPLKNRSFATLSGGQRQRVLIARALVSKPEVLLLDEPTANVDRKTEQDLYVLIQELSKIYTVILVSHDLGVVPKISDRIACVNRNVIMHLKSELTGQSIQEIYSCSMDLVHHVNHSQRKEGG
ncbi:MAG: ABC transporter ATP-binding protein [Spirochaetales bacterium]|nr:ABC transporter ATP-binding protein [Spirochaetales bacterium]